MHITTLFFQATYVPQQLELPPKAIFITAVPVSQYSSVSDANGVHDTISNHNGTDISDVFLHICGNLLVPHKWFQKTNMKCSVLPDI